jgi:phenylalanyl-tRNA synthetase beta chain
MKISPKWLRALVSGTLPDDRALAEALTAAGLAVEGISDSGFEMEITTNRPDAMNHYGIARECSAIFDVGLKPLTAKLPAPNGAAVPVDIQVPEQCARFTGRAVRNVRIGPAPAHVQQQLNALDHRAINNAADATNYVMWLMGKPTHAFDLDKLEGGRLMIRHAHAGERLKTLDGVERTLHPEDVVVADAVKAVALAGVMGGWDSMITESTRNIFIESAWWNPASVRKTAKRHAIHTDASHRFERGADWASCVLSTDLVAQMILESAGGQVSDLIDAIARAVGHSPVQLRGAEVARILGKGIPAAEIERILQRLGFTLSGAQSKSSDYTVAIPTWRLDVEREIDLIEEIARIRGYNNFPNTLPAWAGGVAELPEAAAIEKVRATLLALGYNEALSSTFIGKSESEAFSAAEPVHIANPLSEEAAYMRTTLVPGMLDMLARNLNRGVSDVRLFEMGHIYETRETNSSEQRSLVIGATGNAVIGSVHEKPRAYSFYDLKGALEKLLSAFQHKQISFEITDLPAYLHPGRSARAVLDCTTVAHLGQLHPDAAAARKLKQDVFVADLALERLLTIPLRAPRYQRLSRFPAVERDFSFLFPDAVTWEHVRSAIHALAISDLRSIAPAEIFRGGSVPAGSYSLLLRSTFQSNERTLTADEVESWSQQIIKSLESLGGALRA